MSCGLVFALGEERGSLLLSPPEKAFRCSYSRQFFS